jgi:hypothetical protein
MFFGCPPFFNLKNCILPSPKFILETISKSHIPHFFTLTLLTNTIVFQKILAGVQTLVWKNQDKSWTPSQNIFLENYISLRNSICGLRVRSL